MSSDAQIQQVGSGSNDVIIVQVDPTMQAARASLRPLEWVGAGPSGTPIGGHFRAAFSYSNTAAKPAATSTILSLRNADPTKLFVLKRLILWLGTTTGYSAALAQDAALWKVTGFVANDSAGTALAASAGQNQRLYTSKMGACGLTASGPIWGWASSGDAVTAGTRTADTYPLGYAIWTNPTAAGGVQGPFNLFDLASAGDMPIVCGQNEGIVVTTPIGNAQAAGVSKWSFFVDWAEVTSF